MIKYLSDRCEWTLKLKQLEHKSPNKVKFRLCALFSIKKIRKPTFQIDFDLVVIVMAHNFYLFIIRQCSINMRL